MKTITEILIGIPMTMGYLTCTLLSLSLFRVLMCRFFSSLVKLIPKYFVLTEVIVNDIAFLESL